MAVSWGDFLRPVSLEAEPEMGAVVLSKSSQVKPVWEWGAQDEAEGEARWTCRFDLKSSLGVSPRAALESEQSHRLSDLVQGADPLAQCELLAMCND